MRTRWNQIRSRYPVGGRCLAVLSVGALACAGVLTLAAQALAQSGMGPEQGFSSGGQRTTLESVPETVTQKLRVPPQEVPLPNYEELFERPAQSWGA